MFELLKTDAHTKARLGRLTTAHGVVDTPVFMPVGTQASVKALDPRELRRDGHPDHPRQHLSPQHPARTRHHPRRRRAASVHELGTARSSPTAAASRFSASPKSGKSSRTASNSVRTSTARRCFSARRRRWKSSACSARTSPWCSTNARRTTRRPRNSAWPSNAPSAGRANAANSRAPEGQTVFGIVQGGSNRRAARGMRQGAGRRWISTATPSAA